MKPHLASCVSMQTNAHKDARTRQFAVTNGGVKKLQLDFGFTFSSVKTPSIKATLTRCAGKLTRGRFKQHKHKKKYKMWCF